MSQEATLQELLKVTRENTEVLHFIQENMVLREEFFGLEKKVDRLEERIGGVEGKIDGLEERIGGLEEKFGGLEEKIGGLEEKFGGLEEKMEMGFQALWQELARLDAKMDQGFSSIHAELAHMQEELEHIKKRLDEIDIRSKQDTDALSRVYLDLKARVKRLEDKMKHVEGQHSLYPSV